MQSQSDVVPISYLHKEYLRSYIVIRIIIGMIARTEFIKRNRVRM